MGSGYPEGYRAAAGDVLDAILSHSRDCIKILNPRGCVIAIAGDRKGDFGELYDYLRDPAAAVSLDSYLGAGWFRTPAAARLT